MAASHDLSSSSSSKATTIRHSVLGGRMLLSGVGCFFVIWLFVVFHTQGQLSQELKDQRLLLDTPPTKKEWTKATARNPAPTKEEASPVKTYSPPRKENKKITQPPRETAPNAPKKNVPPNIKKSPPREDKTKAPRKAPKGQKKEQEVKDKRQKSSAATRAKTPSIHKPPKNAESPSRKKLPLPAKEAPKEKKEDSFLKCSPWDDNMDDWWQDHPDWEPSLDDTNDTHTCFRPIDNPQRAEFYRQVHAIQFSGQCSIQRKDKNKILVRKLEDFGFAAIVLHVITEGIWSAFLQGRGFQYSHPFKGFQWLYVPKNQSSWAYCPSQDFECYFLPLSSCEHPSPKIKEEAPKRKHLWGDTEKNHTLWLQNIWMSHYVARPRQELRRHLYQFQQQHAPPPISTPCTWIHVRRGDAMSEKGYDRNFYSIQEYLTRGKIDKQDTVLLLTDDQSAIDEATLLHPDYKWVYWNRTRNRGPTAFNSHLPSGDPAQEVLLLLAELEWAARTSHCRRGIYGKSNMARWIRNQAVVWQGADHVEYMEIDQKLKKTRVEATDFMKDLDAKLAKAAANQ